MDGRVLGIAKKKAADGTLGVWLLSLEKAGYGGLRKEIMQHSDVKSIVAAREAEAKKRPSSSKQEIRRASASEEALSAFGETADRLRRSRRR